MLVIMANWEDPDLTASHVQNQSYLGLHFLFRPFMQATSV